jgi:hypothetical protein
VTAEFTWGPPPFLYVPEHVRVAAEYTIVCDELPARFGVDAYCNYWARKLCPQGDHRVQD